MELNIAKDSMFVWPVRGVVSRLSEFGRCVLFQLRDEVEVDALAVGTNRRSLFRASE